MPTNIKLKKVLIVGAGSAGKMVFNEIKNHKELNYKISGFIDDNIKTKKINGIPVFQNTNNLPELIKQKKIDLVIISIPTATGEQIRKIVSKCKSNKNTEIKIVPGLWKIIKGDVTLSQIRDVKPEDLLGRETVKLNKQQLKNHFFNKTILITGAAGSIGSELCKQILTFKIKKLILIDQNESELYYLQQELKKYNNCIYYISDITNYSRLNYIFKINKPEIIFHAAAYKHVPLMEHNISEAVRVNIIGSYYIAEFSKKYKAESVILISSDKAVNPTSIMGASKRIAEKIFLLFANSKTKTKYSSVRFGNVLGSRGSVVPIFLEQIREGGPITITHPEIYRFFMTIPEAVTLVLNSIKITKGKEIFVLDMGEMIKITDLAKNLIILSGLEPDKDIKIKFTGLRPGEKLYEELLTDSDKVNSTKSTKIFIAKQKNIINLKTKDLILQFFSILKKYDKNTDDKLLKLIKKLVPEYQAKS